MPTPQVGNPALAFQSAGQDNLPEAGKLTTYMVAGGTVKANSAVYFTYNTSTGILNATAATAANVASPGGFSLSAASTVGQIIEVCLDGIFQVAGGATLAAGAVFSIGASGWTAAASTVIGSNWGITLQPQVPGGGLYWAQLARM